MKNGQPSPSQPGLAHCGLKFFSSVAEDSRLASSFPRELFSSFSSEISFSESQFVCLPLQVLHFNEPRDESSYCCCGNMNPDGYTVEVTGLSPKATEKDVLDFFAFSGAIELVEIVRYSFLPYPAFNSMSSSM